jgi:CheY-like chemotaxis protein/two-component sensor histidine kinase
VGERSESVSRDNVAIFFRRRGLPFEPAVHWVFAADIDATYEELRLRGARIIEPLEKQNDQATVARGLDIVARNTRLQTQLISDLLDISRIVSGKLRLDLQGVDLASVIDAAVETVQHVADQKGVVMDRQLDTSIGPMAGDPARLQQIVWNLLSNALKFTPKGGRVRVVLRRTGSQAEIIVEDNGAGIRPDFLPYVFDRFQQADASRTRRFGGLGLGLSIVRSLVEFHGGTVKAASAGEGNGATFTIVLPMAAPSERRAEALAARDAKIEDISLANIRVLVVEDEPDAAEFVTNLLAMHGADVVTAASAREALDAVVHARPDILISDIGLPEMDGYQLMEQIRKMNVTDGGGIPAVALTAFARSEDRTPRVARGLSDAPGKTDRVDGTGRDSGQLCRVGERQADSTRRAVGELSAQRRSRRSGARIDDQEFYQLLDRQRCGGGRYRTRTYDLVRVKHAL